jgi:hypothetical protein
MLGKEQRKSEEVITVKKERKGNGRYEFSA